MYGKGLVASQKNAGDKMFYQQDTLGSNRIVTDASGRVKSKYAPYPYGKTVSQDGTETAESKYSFTGKEDDGKLQYFGARYYHPGIARFASVDPIAGIGSPYKYAADNPLGFADPDGKNPLAVISYPTYDTLYNGAFSDDRLRTAKAQLEGAGYDVYIAPRGVGIRAALKGGSAAYGGRQVNLFWDGAHGAPGMIENGNANAGSISDYNAYTGRTVLDSMADPSINLAPDAILILESCAGALGGEGGIARASLLSIADAFGQSGKFAYVLASSGVSSLYDNELKSFEISLGGVPRAQFKTKIQGWTKDGYALLNLGGIAVELFKNERGQISVNKATQEGKTVTDAFSAALNMVGTTPASLAERYERSLFYFEWLRSLNRGSKQMVDSPTTPQKGDDEPKLA